MREVLARRKADRPLGLTFYFSANGLMNVRDDTGILYLGSGIIRRAKSLLSEGKSDRSTSLGITWSGVSFLLKTAFPFFLGVPV